MTLLVLFYLWLILMAVFAMLSLLTLVTYLRYGVAGLFTYLSTFLFVCVTVIVVLVTSSAMMSIDWNQPLNLTRPSVEIDNFDL